MNEERVVYSIQRTYIVKPVSKLEKDILTCDERIDIPTIKPLLNLKPLFLENLPLTVLPVKIQPGSEKPLENPYLDFRYVLVLPRGATGVKSCKIIHKEVQHNLTFGIMPPPYNYDNALFGCYTDTTLKSWGALLDV